MIYVIERYKELNGYLITDCLIRSIFWNTLRSYHTIEEASEDVNKWGIPNANLVWDLKNKDSIDPKLMNPKVLYKNTRKTRELPAAEIFT